MKEYWPDSLALCCQLVTLLLKLGANTRVQDSDGVTACNGDTDSDVRELFRERTD